MEMSLGLKHVDSSEYSGRMYMEKDNSITAFDFSVSGLMNKGSEWAVSCTFASIARELKSIKRVSGKQSCFVNLSLIGPTKERFNEYIWLIS